MITVVRISYKKKNSITKKIIIITRRRRTKPLSNCKPRESDASGKKRKIFKTQLAWLLKEAWFDTTKYFYKTDEEIFYDSYFFVVRVKDDSKNCPKI